MWIYIIYMINAIVVMVILVLKCILGNLSRADDELEDEMMPAEEVILNHQFSQSSSS